MTKRNSIASYEKRSPISNINIKVKIRDKGDTVSCKRKYYFPIDNPNHLWKDPVKY